MTSGSIGFAQARSISTEFDGENISLNVTRADGSSLILDSDSDFFDGVILESFWDGYEYFQDDLIEVTTLSAGAQISGARIAVHHHESDSTDYTAFGYWTDIKIDSSPSITAMELGVFADGPEFDNSANLPIIGSATYSGDAIMGYFYQDSRFAEMGDYEGSLDLSADFGSREPRKKAGSGIKKEK